MKTIEVRCAECGALPGIMCRVGGPGSADARNLHKCRVELAADWTQLFTLGETLGFKHGPDMHEVEFLMHFGETRRIRSCARDLMVLAESLGYTEPGDQEAA